MNRMSEPSEYPWHSKYWISNLIIKLWKYSNSIKYSIKDESYNETIWVIICIYGIRLSLNVYIILSLKYNSANFNVNINVYDSSN